MVKSNSKDRALDWLLAHSQEVDASIAKGLLTGTSQPKPVRPAEGAAGSHFRDGGTRIFIFSYSTFILSPSLILE